MIRATSRRFQRSEDKGEDEPSIVLTHDDVSILWHVYRNRLIDSEAIYRLFPGRSPQALSRRLNRLFRQHYIGRPPKQVELYPLGSGSHHMVYGLDRVGALVLNERFCLRIQPYHWLQKNNEITRANIAHTVATTNFMVDLALSMGATKQARLIYFDELLAEYANSATRHLPMPDRWSTDVDWNGHRGKQGTRPDRIFAIEYYNLPAGANRSFFYLEIDEGTETIEPGLAQCQSPAFFRRSSILRKLVVYAYSFINQTHHTHFGFPKPARVLFLTTSKSRIASMQATYMRHFTNQPLIIKPGHFLFADKDAWTGAGLNQFGLSWTNGVGRENYLDSR